jgi:hypothetical protein
MKPINQLLPEVIQKWWEIYGQSNAAMFDKFGVNYYTQEDFDYFYSGYGGSLPSFFGSIAMTYEQASARARITTRPDGTKLSLRDGTWHHFLSSMATLITTAERREERLRDFHKYYVEIDKRYASHKMREFYVPPTDPARFNKLVHRIQTIGGIVHRAENEFTVKGAFNFFNGKREDITLPAGTAIIATKQFAGNAIMGVMSPENPLDEEFLAEERERMHMNLESRFYDITAWALPLTYGIQAYYAGTPGSVDKSVFPSVEDMREEYAKPDKAKVAYLISPDSNANITLVSKLFNAGYKLRVARLSFELDGRNYPPGTVVIRVIRNPESLHEDIHSFMTATGGVAYAADTGYTTRGIDLGSDNVLHLKTPKIAMMGDHPISSRAFGALRYLFEQVYDVDYTAFRSMDFRRIDLDDFNVIILPNSYGRGGYSIADFIGKSGIERLKRWVSDGGVVIAFGGSVDFLRLDDVKMTAAPKYSQRRLEPGDVENPYSEVPPEKEATDKDQKKTDGKKDEKKYEVEKLYRVPGAILKVRLDKRSFLSWGYDRGFVTALVNSTNIYEPISDDQGIAAGRYYAKDEMIVSGFMWPESMEALPGKAYTWHESFGRGMVICFAEEPYFRASYDGLDRMLFNAIFFASAFLN